MGLHKLTAGDGYSYLTRQVAAADSTQRGVSSLADYYSEKGETPGLWSGTGLTALGSVAPNSQVSEAQMKALFGEGLHPDADQIFLAAIGAGATSKEAARSAQLGRSFKIDGGATKFRVACAAAFVEFNTGNGHKWNAPIQDDDRARIRTGVATSMFEGEFGRSPSDARELSGWVARIGRQNTKAVAGYDLTFTPVKSVSALWAIAPLDVAAQIEAAHDAAVQAALLFLERNATFSRTGTNGVAQVDTDGLIAAAFTHRDSRAGDPNLHTHVAISNKVRTVGADGATRWLALDGRPLYRNVVSASEVYNTVLEAEVRSKVGGRFAERRSGDSRRRPVRELVGVDDRLTAAWSSRRAMIVHRTGELASQFQRDHGREPTAIESISLAQQATLETRAAKHEPRSLADQRSVWWSEAAKILGSDRSVVDMIATATTQHHRPGAERSDAWIESCADRIVDTVSRERSRWRINHVRAEAIRLVRGNDLSSGEIEDVVGRIVAMACDPARAVDLSNSRDAGVESQTPTVLRRRDGTDVYTQHESSYFTSEAVLAAESRVLRAATLRGGRSARPSDIELALLESAANGRELNAGQRSLVRELASSGARLQLALAPAGTGKTTAMRSLGRAWLNSGGTVVGLAPTATAAALLRDDLGATTDTVAKLLFVLENRPTSTGQTAWVDNIGPDTLVVIDEAGMTSTLDLDTAINELLRRGASVRLIGDDQQLASIAAGGVLRDIHDTVGAVTLSNVVRFSDPSEGAASLALRDGDDAAIGFYIDHGRVHVGSDVTVAYDAYRGWATDRAAGRDAVLLAPTLEVVNTLNARARTDRIAAGGARPGREVRLSDGLAASAGDIICTRKNERRLPMTASDWVRNGDRWTVEKATRSGKLVVRHLGLGRKLTLPAQYVADHVTLGYASTVHSAQGMTADVCHTVATGAETRQILYVAMTRGRHGNHLYLPTASNGDLQLAMTERGLLPPTAVDDLRTILARDGAQKSAHTTAREVNDPFRLLGPAAAAYRDAVGTAAETHVGPERLSHITQSAEGLVDAISDAPAWPVLRMHLAMLEANGVDALDALESAFSSGRELTTADDPAAVLQWRLPAPRPSTPGTDVSPLPWLPPIPVALQADTQWAPYLSARAALVVEHASAVHEASQQWTPTTSPTWARPFVGSADRDLPSDLAVFRAAHDVPDADRRTCGPDQFAAAPRLAQEQLISRAELIAGDDASAARTWQPAVDQIDRHVARDPYWPNLAERLATASQAGIDVHSLIEEAVADRPLPDEIPAAALWWRLSGALGDAVLEADGLGPTVRPPWSEHLVAALGSVDAERVMTDAAWPALVSAVDAASPRSWTPASLLDTAVGLLDPGVGDTQGVRPHELARALTWRIELLVHDRGSWQVIDPPTEPEIGSEFDDAHCDRSFEPSSTDDTVADSLAVLDADYYLSLDTIEPAEPQGKTDSLPDAPDAAEEWQLYADNAQHVADLAYPNVAADERVSLLRANIDEAREELHSLRNELMDGRGPSMTAVAPTLMGMRETADRQRPAMIAMLDARHTWIESDCAAEVVRGQIGQFTSDKKVALEIGDDDRAAALEGTIAWETWRLTMLVTRVNADRTAAEAAAATYEDVGVADGGHVTPEDVLDARWEAMDLDAVGVSAASKRVNTLQGQLVRAERIAAEEYARSRVDEIVKSAAPATERPFQALSHTELMHVIDRAETDLRQATLLVASQTDRVPSIERVHKEQRRIREQAELIALARAARTVYDAASAELSSACQGLTTAGGARMRFRRTHVSPDPAAHDRLRQARDAVAQALRTATAAKNEVRLPEGAWESIIERSQDSDAWSAEASAAARDDLAAAETNTKMKVKAERLRSIIEQGREEQRQRRAGKVANSEGGQSLLIDRHTRTRGARALSGEQAHQLMPGTNLRAHNVTHDVGSER
ncbi:MobF family relaxase [Rhodococcoides trifolii]|nr:MobF family relaxase [Rhodococcus trifolii]